MGNQFLNGSTLTLFILLSNITLSFKESMKTTSKLPLFEIKNSHKWLSWVEASRVSGSPLIV
jgi:hypothetical protein